MGSSHRTARTDVLRPVLEIALGVARSAEGRADAPRVLGPVLKMKTLRSPAWATVDRAGADDAFRALVAEAVDPDDLDDAGRLWLTRPEGWEDELTAIVDARRAVALADDAERDLRRERTARQRAEEEREALRTRVAGLEAERQEAGERADGAEAWAAAAEERADQALAERTQAVRELGTIKERNQELHAERRELKAALAQAERRAPDAAPEPVTAAPPAERVVPSAPEPAPAPVPTPPEPPFDQEAASAAVGTASEAAAALAGALDELSALLRPAPVDAPRRRASPRPVRPRRQAPPLPGGLHDDSPEVADHLVRLPGCVLLVDGYNATLTTWADDDLPLQRRRLVDGVDRLESRVAGLDATIVFDGVEESRSGRSPSQRVHVHFTPAGVEADDVILDLVERVDLDRPVVVASDDLRVRDGARRRGARPIGIAQLQAVMT